MKPYLKEFLILAIPIAIAVILYAVLPDQIPMRYDSAGTLIESADKRNLLILGFVPFAGYKLKQWRQKTH